MKKKVVLLMCIIAVIVLFIADASYDYESIVARQKHMNSLIYNLITLINKNVSLTQNLISLANEYAEEEKELINNIRVSVLKVVRATTIKEKIESNTELNNSYNALMEVLKDDYPEIIESESFTKISNEISNTQKRIVSVRENYNRTVEFINNNIREFAFAKKLKIKTVEYI